MVAGHQMRHDPHRGRNFKPQRLHAGKAYDVPHLREMVTRQTHRRPGLLRRTRRSHLLLQAVRPPCHIGHRLITLAEAYGERLQLIIADNDGHVS